MKTIFKNMTGEWDNFGNPGVMEPKIHERIMHLNNRSYSLADLLANKSWCKAVFGTEKVAGHERWTNHAVIAFDKLLHHGEQRCIEFIKQTMKK